YSRSRTTRGVPVISSAIPGAPPAGRRIHDVPTCREASSPVARHTSIASGRSLYDGAGSSAEGTEGQPVRTLSTIGVAVCSTAATDAAILPRLVERLSWLLSPVMVA